MTKMQKIYEAVINGSSDVVVNLVRAAIEEGESAETILNDGLISAMGEIGKLYEQGDLFVPEMLIAARAMQAGMGEIKPLLVKDGIESTGKVVIATVKGDLHDIGKNLVAMMLEGSGFEVIDLGTDVPTEEFIKVIAEQKPEIVGMSALLTTTMPSMKEVIEALDDSNLRDSVKVMIGGAPVTDDFAKEIGADGFAADASRAVSLAKSLLNV